MLGETRLGLLGGRRFRGRVDRLAEENVDRMFSAAMVGIGPRALFSGRVEDQAAGPVGRLW